jgi:hypothetical protein
MSRPDWIGTGDLFPISCVVNHHWTSMQNLEYENAYKKQKVVIKCAIKNEKNTAKQARLDWDGMISPNPENLVLDKIWKLKEVEKKIQFKKGLICGLEISRESNDSLWELSKSEVVLLEVEQIKILKEINKMNPDVLESRMMCIFEKKEPMINDVSSLGKRSLDNPDEAENKTSVKKPVVPGETIEYWLTGTRMVTAMRILKWDKDETNDA